MERLYRHCYGEDAMKGKLQLVQKRPQESGRLEADGAEVLPCH